MTALIAVIVRPAFFCAPLNIPKPDFLQFPSVPLYLFSPFPVLLLLIWYVPGTRCNRLQNSSNMKNCDVSVIKDQPLSSTPRSWSSQTGLLLMDGCKNKIGLYQVQQLQRMQGEHLACPTLATHGIDIQWLCGHFPLSFVADSVL